MICIGSTCNIQRLHSTTKNLDKMVLRGSKANFEVELFLLQLQVLRVLKYRILQYNEHILENTQLSFFKWEQVFFFFFCLKIVLILSSTNISNGLKYPWHSRSEQSTTLKWAFKLDGWSSELNMKWETNPSKLWEICIFFSKVRY